MVVILSKITKLFVKISTILVVLKITHNSIIIHQSRTYLEYKGMIVIFSLLTYTMYIT